MCLFGDFKSKPDTKKMTLLQMAEYLFDDNEVIKAIKDYLASRKQQHNLPSKVAWEKQLNMLLKVQPNDRARMVENSTVKGYRQIVYLDSYKPSVARYTVAREKANTHTVSQGF